MHRKQLMKRAASRQQAIVYTAAVIALSVYAIPRIPPLAHGLRGTFSMAWLLFAALVTFANLYFAFGADRERARNLDLQRRSEAAEKASLRANASRQMERAKG